MRPTSSSMLPGSAGVCASTRNSATNLEWFWPSRRGHAFDELCR